MSLPPDTDAQFIAPGGRTISARRFVEEFTGAIAVGYIALREPGDEIGISRLMLSTFPATVRSYACSTKL